MLENQLQHGKRFLTGDKLATCDFFAATYFFSDIYNDNLSAQHGSLWAKEPRRIVEKSELVKKYMESLKEELKEYLASRPARPF